MRVLLVEDDKKVADFVSKGLHEAGYVIDHVSDGHSGFQYAARGGYDALVMDIMLPGIDGLTVIERLRAEKINTPILVLSAKSDIDDRVKGLRSGGDDYLTKPFAFAELMARIQALLRRSSGNNNQPTTLEVGDLTLDLLTREALRGGELISLQRKEFELLEYLMRNKGLVVSKTMIIEHVWNFSFDPQTNVVEVRMSRLREKIDKPFEKKLIHTVWGAGYVIKAMD